MDVPTVGSVAPTFRLPSAKGDEIGLEDFRGQKNVVVWFTKGMACPFCRAQMSRVARVYADIQRRGAEVLQVTISSPRQAKIYAEKFQIPFPYLADPDYRVRCEWGLEYRSNGPAYYVKNIIAGARMEQPENDFGKFAPPLGEMLKLVTDDDMGFFIVDKAGVIRYVLAGSYIVPGQGDRPLPSNEEILRELERCSAKPVPG